VLVQCGETEPMRGHMIAAFLSPNHTASRPKQHRIRACPAWTTPVWASQRQKSGTISHRSSTKRARLWASSLMSFSFVSRGRRF
jgi:hypothetical protein